MNILLSDIPEYLKRSDLYKNMLQENLDQIHLELENKIPQEEKCDNLDEYIQLFKVYNFWCCNPGKSFTEYQERNKIDVLKFLISVIDKYDFAKLLINEIYLPPKLDVNYQISDTKRIIIINEVEIEIDTKLYIVSLEIKDTSMNNNIQFKFYYSCNVIYFITFFLLLLKGQLDNIFSVKMDMESCSIKTMENSSNTNRIMNVNGYNIKLIDNILEISDETVNVFIKIHLNEDTKVNFYNNIINKVSTETEIFQEHQITSIKNIINGSGSLSL